MDETQRVTGTRRAGRGRGGNGNDRTRAIRRREPVQAACHGCSRVLMFQLTTLIITVRSAAMALVSHQTELIYCRYAITDKAMLRETDLKLGRSRTQASLLATTSDTTMATRRRSRPCCGHCAAIFLLPATATNHLSD